MSYNNDAEQKEAAVTVSVDEKTKLLNNNNNNNNAPVPVPHNQYRATEKTVHYVNTVDADHGEWENAETEYILGGGFLDPRDLNSDFIGDETIQKCKQSTKDYLVVVLLVTEPIKCMTFYKWPNNHNAIQAVQFDGTYGNYAAHRAHPNDVRDCVEIATSDDEPYLYFDQIEIQYIYDASATHTFFKNISYLKFVTGDQEWQLGEKRKEIGTDAVYAFGEAKNLRRFVTRTQSVNARRNGKLILTGVGFSLTGLAFLQIVDVLDDTCVLDTIFHCAGEQRVQAAQNNLRQIRRASIIGVENANVLSVMKQISSLLVRWKGDPDIVFLATFTDIIKLCIDGDLETMYSVFALKRFLNHILRADMTFFADASAGQQLQQQQRQQAVQGYGNGAGNGSAAGQGYGYGGYGSGPAGQQPRQPLQKLNRNLDAFDGDECSDWRTNASFSTMFDGKHGPDIRKLRDMWKSLTDVILLTKRIHTNHPSFNIYSFTTFKPTLANYGLSLVTFSVQIGLLVLVILSLNLANFWSLPVSIAGSIVIPFIVVIVIKKQMQECIGFWSTFPALQYHPTMFLDLFVNIILGVVVIAVQFIILATTTSYLSLVLNCLTIVFILTLDRVVVNVGANQQRAMFLDYATHLLIEALFPKKATTTKNATNV